MRLIVSNRMALKISFNDFGKKLMPKLILKLILTIKVIN